MAVNDILIAFGQKIVKELKDNLNTYGYKGGKIDASKELRNSIKFTTKIMGNDFVFELKMKDYYEWVDEGRKPNNKGAGKYPTVNPDNIIKWIKTKPNLRDLVAYKNKTEEVTIGRGSKTKRSVLSDSKLRSLAYVISRKIKEKGIKPTNFFSDVYNDEALLDLKKKLSTELKREVIIELTRIE